MYVRNTQILGTKKCPVLSLSITSAPGTRNKPQNLWLLPKADPLSGIDVCQHPRHL